MVLDLGPFRSRPSGAVEGERLLASFGVVDRGRHCVHGCEEGRRPGRDGSVEDQPRRVLDASRQAMGCSAVDREIRRARRRWLATGAESRR
eukprot:1765584-Pleurochrysis_carterae.AAC.1